MDTQRNIALMGKSGAGKTTVAEILVAAYGYHICTPGGICREVCKLVFGREERAEMNHVTGLFKTMDELVWIKAALRNAPDDTLIVYDSMRFAQDYAYLRDEEFEVWRIDASEETRHRRLRGRGQSFTAEDEKHALENELSDNYCHHTIDNEPELATGALALRIADLMGAARPVTA